MSEEVKQSRWKMMEYYYTKTGPKRRLQHRNNLGTRRKKKNGKIKNHLGTERLKRKEQKQDGNRGRKWRPLRVIKINGGTPWRPYYVPRGTKSVDEKSKKGIRPSFPVNQNKRQSIRESHWIVLTSHILIFPSELSSNFSSMYSLNFSTSSCDGFWNKRSQKVKLINKYM